MGWLARSLNSSIGKKFVMALTGFFLIVFLKVHLIGNLTLFLGAEAFNNYVAALDVVKPLIRVIEVILALGFIFHIVTGMRLWRENRISKAGGYKINTLSKSSSIFSRTMVQTGSIVFIFLILHLSTIWYAFNFNGHSETSSYFDILVDWLVNPYYSGFYILAVLLLGFHLNHGIQSAFQTFGWNHSKYFSLIQKLGSIFATLMGIGFASIPIYFLFFYGGR